jgi:hypothetical protein
MAWRIDYEDALRSLVRRRRTLEQENAVLTTMIEWEDNGPPDEDVASSLDGVNFFFDTDYGERIAYRVFPCPGYEPAGFVYVVAISRLPRSR